ncbi:amidase family protein [Arcticibacterium luteifluviistationis]|uniref:Asp-tRNA(Asn)/Glu-tRNA(Gln) amidotransferase subunit GatA n=1 Tax=Arcticibacterium luteifluviistationis TaxID=1784714 RepID=A0A2Z4G8L9_9BACT|nr:amidase family protein [Arcticibacterium luteifluviistationis]AWV97531.1 Asp-tRNA(Asn)/Glu-tRNA(Gln) amidotransferase subunit GatA [Arcticibacterium luteifluviistationis]
MESEILKLHNALLNKEITCQELVQGKLDSLAASTNNSANFVLTEKALEKAALVDAKINKGESIGLLEGIPFGLKDVYLLQGEPASASSDFLKKYISPYTATAIQKLIDAGAIPIVKENCDSFGHGSSTENTVFGSAKNALDENKVAGGSSGGSAVNVAKNYTAFSIGGDTGGSIRQPAGYNKVYGLKPTYGRISRYGLMAYASSTDVVGPIAKSLEDIRIILNTLSGQDYHDQTTIESTPVSKEVVEDTDKAKTLKVGYYKNFIETEAIHPNIKKDFLSLMTKLKALGVSVTELDFYESDTLVSTYYTLAMAETASNLARLDGTNYGDRKEGKNLKEIYAQTRSDNFTEETKRRIVGGNQVLSTGHSEAIYLKARALRNEISDKFSSDFETVDIVLSPVTPQPTPLIGENLKDPLAMYLSDAYTVGFSLGGLPTLTAPQGTETGLQITANKSGEDSILQFANFLNSIEA